ncbi:MAG: MarR family winged helix-turn-helix transcriptional regulator [Acidaminobacteraceae bacterium]
MNNTDELAKSLEKLLQLKSKCHLQMVDDLGISDMTIKQLNYIKHFLDKEDMTTSQLAEDLELTKPTVTELVKKFIKQDYLYKVSCPHDGRVHYLRLTETGHKIATLAQLTNVYLAERLKVKLGSDDLKSLTATLNKIDL